jgi:lipoate-protein ligase A
MWRYFEEEAAQASYAVAMDEFLTNAYRSSGVVPDPILRLYTFRPHCALLGRFQHAASEVRLDQCHQSGVEVNRRRTGGGTVIMGEGQLAVSFFASAQQNHVPKGAEAILDTYGRVMARAVRRLGLEAELSERGHLLIDGKRMGACGVYLDKEDAVFFQAWLLVSLEMPLVVRVLCLPEFADPRGAVNAILEQVTTLNIAKGQSVEMAVVRRHVRSAFEAAFGIQFQEFPITPLERSRAEEIERSRYGTAAWIYDRTPAPEMVGRSMMSTRGGTLRVYAEAKGDTVESVLITGDFLGVEDVVRGVEMALRRCPAIQDEIRRRIEENLEPGSIVGISSLELSSAVTEAVRDALGRPYSSLTGPGGS